jgi:hypothetical protein
VEVGIWVREGIVAEEGTVGGTVMEGVVEVGEVWHTALMVMGGRR